MDVIERYRQRREDRLAIKRFKERRAQRLDARFDEEEIWRTTEGGKHYAMNGKGEITKGPKAMVGKNISEVAEEAAKKSGAPASRGTKRSAKSVSKAFNRLLKGVGFKPNLQRLTQRTMAVGNPFYKKAEEIIKNRPELRLYSNHTWEHVETVAKKTAEAAAVINGADLGDYYGKIDEYEAHAAALMHDTGMDGDSKKYANSEKGDNKLRKEHPMNSAVHVLENRDELKKAGLDPDKIALDVLAHSKSMSGVRHLTSEKEWGNALRRIDDRCKEYNATNPDKPPIHFDVSAWSDGTKDKDGDYIITNKKQLGITAATAAALRLGDANRDASKEPSTQGGARIDIDWDSYDPNAKSAAEERDRAKATFTDNKGRKYDVGEGKQARTGKAETFSKGVHIGENNISTIKTTLQGGKVTEEFTIKDATKFPYLTGEAICERIGELNTIDGIPSQVIIKVKGIRKKSQAADDFEKKVSAAWTGKNYGNKAKHVKVKWEYEP